MYLAGLVVVTTANVLTGSIFEFLKRPSRINVGIRNLSAVVAGNTFSFEIQDQIIARDAVIVQQNLVPLDSLRFPDDYPIQQEPGLPGDRLTFQITRSAGTTMWAVSVTEVV